ncbi:MAG: ABC transporter permease subunit [Clostridiales bacterium]|nr:ABC transporter permease subunit [Clostridiales bacterium]
MSWEVFGEALGLMFGANPELRNILLVTLRMSLTSTTVAVCIGVPLGVLLGTSNFKGRKLILKIIHTLMGLPPVVAGLVVFLLLSRSGPLGALRLLFSVTAMVIAQVVLITPIVMGLTSSIVSAKAPQIMETTAGIGLSRRRTLWLILKECRPQLISVVLTGFGRAISEVGAVQLVGGNVQFKTRVMTTTIMLETNKGNFGLAVALGILLLIIAFGINAIAAKLQEERP